MAKVGLWLLCLIDYYVMVGWYVLIGSFVLGDVVGVKLSGG